MRRERDFGNDEYNGERSGDTSLPLGDKGEAGVDASSGEMSKEREGEIGGVDVGEMRGLTLIEAGSDGDGGSDIPADEMRAAELTPIDGG